LAGLIGLVVAVVAIAWEPAAAQRSASILGAPKELRVGVVTFRSGPVSGTFGIPAKQAADVWIDKINEEGGIGGAKVAQVPADEEGSGDKVVSEFRRLVLDEKIDLVIGYASSANCLAVPPVAEELKVLTVLFDCGTTRVFEEGKYKYVFRTAAHTAIDGIAAARYLLAAKPDVKTVAGLNEDYAWGRDSWAIFSRALRKLKPEVQVVATVWLLRAGRAHALAAPKLFQEELSAEISTLLSAKPDVIFHSLWGPDLRSLNSQGRVRGLFQQSLVIHNNSAFQMKEFRNELPDNVVVGFRGTHWPDVPDRTRNQLQKEFVERCIKKYGDPCGPPHGSYHMVQALQGVKAAYEKAAKATGRWPTLDQVIRAFEYLEFESPSGRIAMAIGGGHQAVEDALYGTVKADPQKRQNVLTKVRVFPANCVNPPDGVKALDWIEQGFPGAQCR
jgi:branched-chain amino acid transport system substrate-binding protein